MTEAIQFIASSVKSLEEQSKTVQDSYKNNTDIISKGVDIAVGLFGGDTIKSIYEGSISRIREQAKHNEVRLLEEVSKNTLNPEVSQKVEDLKSRLAHLQGRGLEDMGAIQMIQNIDVKQAGINTLYGLKGQVKGVIHGLKGIITGAFDLASFMVKYSGSMLGIHPEYKQKIDGQAEKLYDWIKKEGMTGVGDQIGKLIEQEMKRISRLPQEEQAEAIGNIAGTIISMLTAIKAGTMIVEKVGKVSRQVTIGSELLKKGGETTQRTERLAKLAGLSEKAKRGKVALQGANVFLNGVAESMIAYSLAKSLTTTLDFIKSTTPSVGQKVSRINESIKEMESALKTEKDTEKQKNIRDAIVKLRAEKIKLERPGQNIQEMGTNAELSIDDRLKKVSELLSGKVLSSQERKVILDVHNNISKGIYQNGYTELRQMSEALKGAGFQKMRSEYLWRMGY